MKNGFVVLDRAIFDHHLLQDADRFRAWCWMISRACWKPAKFDVKGKTITLERGQLCASRHQLAEAWKWSPSAVERFLTRLQTEQMIGRETGQGRSIITICNYSKYQDVPAETGQVSGQDTGQQSDSNRTAKEPSNQETIKPEPKGSKARKRADRPDDISETVWNDFNAQRKKLFTPTALAGFRREADKAGWKIEDAMALAAMRGWEGFNAGWVKEDRNGKSNGDKRDGVAKALDRRLGLGTGGEAQRSDFGGDGRDRALPAPADGTMWS